MEVDVTNFIYSFLHCKGYEAKPSMSLCLLVHQHHSFFNSSCRCESDYSNPDKEAILTKLCEIFLDLLSRSFLANTSNKYFLALVFFAL